MLWLPRLALVDMLAGATGSAVVWCPSRGGASSGRER